MSLQAALDAAIDRLSHEHNAAIERIAEHAKASGAEQPYALAYPPPSSVPANLTSYAIVFDAAGHELGRVWVKCPDMDAWEPVLCVQWSIVGAQTRSHPAPVVIASPRP